MFSRKMEELRTAPEAGKAWYQGRCKSTNPQAQSLHLHESTTYLISLRLSVTIWGKDQRPRLIVGKFFA